MKDTAAVRRLRAIEFTPGRVVLAIAVVASILSSRVASAQSERDAAVRLELLQQAQDARNHGYHARALDLAQRAGAISMTPSLRLFIAEESQSFGRLAEAYAAAELCAREADHDVTLRNRAAILVSCRTLTQNLRPQLGNVIVHVPDPNAQGLRVVVAGTEVNRAFLGVPYFVTPGNVTVDVTANGQPPFHTTVQVAAGRDVDVPVTFGATAVARVEPVHTEPTHTEPVHTEPAHTEPTHTEPVHTEPTHAVTETPPSGTAATLTRSTPVGPIALMGVGAAGVIAGVVFLTVGQIALGTISHDCSPPDASGTAHCDPGTMNDVQSAASTVNWTNIAMPVAFGVGGVALVGGAVWYFVSGRSSQEHARVRIVPILTATSAGIGGVF